MTQFGEDLVATFNCGECTCPTFYIVQVNNRLMLLCTECGYTTDIQDSVNQLKAARQFEMEEAECKKRK